MALIFVNYILFDFINKNSVFFNLHVLVFCFGTKTMDFHWYRYQIQTFWYRDNTNIMVY